MFAEFTNSAVVPGGLASLIAAKIGCFSKLHRSLIWQVSGCLARLVEALQVLDRQLLAIPLKWETVDCIHEQDDCVEYQASLI